MYSLFLFLSLALVPRSCCVPLDRRSWRGLGAVGRGDAPHRRRAPVRRARPRRPGRVRADRAARALRAAAVAVRGRHRRRDAVLAHRSRPRRAVRRRRRRPRREARRPWAIVTYLWQTAGDFSSRSVAGARRSCSLLAAVGLVAVGRETRALALCAIGVPVAAFLAARLGGSTSPESRHLIFVLPFFAILVAAGILRPRGGSRRRGRADVRPRRCSRSAGPGSGRRSSSNGSPNKRQATRAQAEQFLAGRAGRTTSSSATSRSTSAPGSAITTSPTSSSPAPTHGSRCGRSLAQPSRSVVASGSSTPASATTSARASRSRIATPAPTARSRRASSAPSSSSAPASRC